MPKIMVIYYSRTGNTKRMAELITEGARTVPGTEVKLVPITDLNYREAEMADALALGSPEYFSYVAGALKIFFDNVLDNAKFKEKPCIAFGTHGGGAKVLSVIEKLADAVGLKQIRKGLQVYGNPVGRQEDECRKLGQDLARAVTSTS